MIEHSINLVVIALGLFGLVMGSFAGATVWRIRKRQLREDAKAGEEVDKKAKKQVKNIRSPSLASDRSVCLHCGHTLAWYDLIPLASWVLLGNKCRYCHKSIGWTEPLIELGVATAFILGYIFWPLPLDTLLAQVQFGLWLMAVIGLAVLLVYDLKWFLLPNVVMFPLMVIGGIYSFITLIQADFQLSQLTNIILGIAFLGGLYFVIYVFSKHRWVGFGDVKLGIVLALLLGGWQSSLLTLFLANLIGTIIILPLLVRGKVKRQTHIPFGPLLIGGWLIASLFGQGIIDWYFSIALVNL